MNDNVINTIDSGESNDKGDDMIGEKEGGEKDPESEPDHDCLADYNYESYVTGEREDAYYENL